jgi:hypothetical protein
MDQRGGVEALLHAEFVYAEIVMAGLVPAIHVFDLD